MTGPTTGLRRAMTRVPRHDGRATDPRRPRRAYKEGYEGRAADPRRTRDGPTKKGAPTDPRRAYDGSAKDPRRTHHEPSAEPTTGLRQTHDTKLRRTHDGPTSDPTTDPRRATTDARRTHDGPATGPPRRVPPRAHCGAHDGPTTDPRHKITTDPRRAYVGPATEPRRAAADPRLARHGATTAYDGP